MTPKDYFDNVWARADIFNVLHAYIANNAAAVLQPEELLRAEWAMRVSALDLYVHETVSQNLLKIFRGTRPTCVGFAKLQLGSATLMTIHAHGAGMSSDNAFDLDVRAKLSRVTYQYPDDIADGIRMIASIELWAEIVRHHGSIGPAIKSDAAALKGELTQIVNRRNKIVHEGDLQPGVPRVPWPISRPDVDHVCDTISLIIDGIEALI